MTVEEWFEQLKQIGKKYGFVANNAEFRKGQYLKGLIFCDVFEISIVCFKKGSRLVPNDESNVKYGVVICGIR